jgi:formylglycine-generating enzyme required for sulfatase activity
MFRFTLVFIAIFVGCLANPVFAAKKIAFVVGINTYDNLGKDKQLKRAINDARAVGKAFDALGFEVSLTEDGSLPVINAQWQNFVEKIESTDTVGIYFSGHGVEIEGLNFLLPRDVPHVAYGRQDRLKRQSLSVAELLLDIRRRQPQVTLLILDACRDHPLIPPEFRSAGPAPGGLAQMDAPRGTFIMYSAGAGETALDRLPQNDPDSVNSVYTRRLLPLLMEPGLALPELARQVRREVHDLAATVPHLQQPAYYDGLIGKFCLAGCETGTEASREWLRVDKRSVAELETFVRRHGSSPEADYARARLVELKKLQVPIAESSTPKTVPSPCDGVEVAIGANERKCMKQRAGKTESFKDCPECPEMVVVPAGSFMMGSPAGEPQRFSDEAQVSATIAWPLAVGRYAITRGEFAAFVQDSGHKIESGCWAYAGTEWTQQADRNWRSPGFTQNDRHPVVCVNWDDAKAYATWLSRKTGKTYRLLSEAEWEYVARAGTTTPFWWGSSITPKQANYDGSVEPYKAGGSKGEYRKATMPVDSFEANPWGIYQVHGNVREWTEDCWNDSNTGNPGTGSARTTGECSRRVLRGGSWVSDPQILRAANRHSYTAVSRYYNLGFRLARTLHQAGMPPRASALPER